MLRRGAIQIIQVARHSGGTCCSASEGEKRIEGLLRKSIQGIAKVDVKDVSNGCGSMYSIEVEASSFKGLSKVAQHKLITGILREEITNMHGLSIKTAVSQ